MKRCTFEKQIDAYLLNRLSEYEKERFEKHYFNCQHCFEALQEREELIAVIKHKGDHIFKDMIEAEAEQARKVAWYDRITAALSPKQWAGFAVSAALILIVALGVMPDRQSQTPQFYLDDDTTRGQSITLISDAIPAEFKWESLGENVEYKISIYNHQLLWKADTTETSLSLPEEIRAKMKPGVTYFWQVKAYSEAGTMIAESSKVKLPPIQK